MKSLDYYRNKHFLGDLVFADLVESRVIDGDFSIGENWLPIVCYRISRKRKVVGLFMDSLSVTSELDIPLSAKVRVNGLMVYVDFRWPTAPSSLIVKIRLSRDPWWSL